MVLIWDPSRSQLIEETISELAEGIKTGKIPPEIRPHTLISLGDKFRKFYGASFKRVKRIPWSEKRFPATADDASGFESFVNELREKVGNGVLINTKRNVPMYISHTDDQLAKILDFREIYMEDEISREEAVSALKDDFGIEISQSRQEFYFPIGNGKKASLEALISKLRDARKQVEIDLTNTECVRGLLFEGIVGMHLMSQYGAENVESQVRKPVFYNDLQGGRHREVYLDFVVEGQNIEVKLRNTLENILDSVLPQTFALSQEEETPIKSAVICRTRNPELDALYRENISLAEEAEKMGINEAGRKIQDVFDYFCLEELLEDDKDKETHLEALTLMDSFDAKDTPAMKTYAKAFVRISDNPEALSDKYRILVNMMKQRKVLSEEDISVLFGEKKNHRISRDVARRMEIIRDMTRKRDYRMLVDMYNLHAKSGASSLDEEAVKALYDLSKDNFVSLCRTVMEEKQQRKLSRKPKREVTSDDILEFHRRAYERKTKEAMRHAKSLSGIVEKKMDLLCIPIYKNAGIDLNNTQYYKNELSAAANVLGKRMNLPASEVEKELLNVLENTHKQYLKVSEVMGVMSSHIEEHLRDIRNTLINNGRFSQEALEGILDKYTDHLKEQRQNFEEYRQKILQEPIAKTLVETIGKIKDKKLGVSRRERDILARLGLMIKGNLEEAVLDGNIAYFESVKEVTEISEFLAWDALEGYAAEVKRLDISKDSPENCWLFAGTERHNRLFASTVNSMDKMIVTMIGAFRSALNEQTQYYHYRGGFIQDVEGLVNDPLVYRKFSLGFHNFATDNASKIVGYSIPGRAIGIENNLYLISTPEGDLDNETFARFIEYMAKKMNNYFFRVIDDVDRKFAPEKQMSLEEKKEFFTRNAERTMKELAKTNAFNYALGSDYLSRKAYNMRVLTRFGTDIADKYRCANPINPEKLSLELKEFTDYIRELDSRDEQMFRDCLTGTNGYSNGAKVET